MTIVKIETKKILIYQFAIKKTKKKLTLTIKTWIDFFQTDLPGKVAQKPFSSSYHLSEYPKNVFDVVSEYENDHRLG